MPIFGDLFDFDDDGMLNEVEQAAELITLDRVMERVRSTDEFWLDDDESYEEDDDY
jgi:hypothetical protein